MPDKNYLRQIIENWIRDEYEISAEDEDSVRSVALLTAHDVTDKLELWGIGNTNA